MFRGGPRLALAAGVAAAAAGLGVAAGGSGPVHGRGPLSGAVSALPASTVNANFTHWDSILRSHTVAEARERDLVTRSAIIDSSSDLEAGLGIRLRDVVWEAYGQGGFGEAAVVRLKRSMPSTAQLRKRGYRPDHELWLATGRLAADESLVTVVALMPHDGVIVIGPGRRAVTAMRATIRGTSPSLAGVRSVAEITRELAGVQTALIQTSGIGCETTQVAVDAETERQAAAAEARSGALVAYSVLGRGLRDGASEDQRFVVAMAFGSARVAADQARIRADLSHGAFVGRSGDMADVLRLRSARSDGSTAVLGYDHPADAEYLMTGRGPLLPASC